MACPGAGFPFASHAPAVNCGVSPRQASVAVGGLTTTHFTSGAPVGAALPATPAAVAVIVALPFATAVTSPPASTRATSGLSAVHVNACPGTTLPFASFATAVNCCVSPSASSVAVAGLTTTEPTPCTTDSTAVPHTPAAVAGIVAEPFATPGARPVPGTRATAPGGDADQANV